MLTPGSISWKVRCSVIKVLNPGFYSTIQDFGRYNYLQYGVPISGVMDWYAASMANALLGNPKEAPVLEMTMVGPVLQFFEQTEICITGADMEARLNGLPLGINKAIAITQGDVLNFGKSIRGFRGYLAVFGGFKTEHVMDSYSMYQGITTNSVISKGSELPFAQKDGVTDKKYAVLRVHKAYINKERIEVFEGPEFNLLSKNQQEKLFSKPHIISNNNNRMAYQLEEPLENSIKAIITSPVLPGTVQLTPKGQLIILMRDCQTTGGYPRVLQLKENAIDILSQKFTGNRIKFKRINI